MECLRLTGVHAAADSRHQRCTEKCCLRFCTGFDSTTRNIRLNLQPGAVARPTAGSDESRDGLRGNMLTSLADEFHFIDCAFQHRLEQVGASVIGGEPDKRASYQRVGMWRSAANQIWEI